MHVGASPACTCTAACTCSRGTPCPPFAGYTACCQWHLKLLRPHAPHAPKGRACARCSHRCSLPMCMPPFPFQGLNRRPSSVVLSGAAAATAIGRVRPPQLPLSFRGLTAGSPRSVVHGGAAGAMRGVCPPPLPLQLVVHMPFLSISITASAHAASSVVLGGAAGAISRVRPPQPPLQLVVLRQQPVVLCFQPRRLAAHHL